MSKLMILKPRLTSEKAYGLSKLRNTYVIDVPGDATKHTVARAVAEQFEVAPTKINIVVKKGKAKRTVRKGGRPVAGRESDVKKAYVTLPAGQSLPFFEAMEEAEEKQAKTAEKLAKATEKAAEKDAKADKPKKLLGRKKKPAANAGKDKETK
jgi:large subunit ribosomal protein L23